MEEAYIHVSLLMLYCALGIHIDESGSPEERQSGDGTSFPESPDLNHVGITAASQRPATRPYQCCLCSEASRYLKARSRCRI